MAKTSNMAALLHVAVQDLHAGRRALAARLPAVAHAATDAALRNLIEAEAARADAQAERLAAAAGDMAGPENLWMKGILDDADRDARSHQPGAVLDVALIGAVRKAMAAAIVSDETAIALAAATDQDPIGEVARENRETAIAADRALAERLRALTVKAS